MKSTWPALAGVVAVGMATSLVLIPSERELALMQFRDADYAGARERYERLLHTANTTVDVYAGLAELYLKFGEVDSAIGIMERYLHEYPESVPGWERLSDLYGYAQRPADRLACLERLVSLDPSKARMQTLAHALGALNRPTDQIRVLAEAAERFETTPSELIQLASRQMAQGMYAQGSRTLERVWQLDPGGLSDGLVEKWVLALLQMGEEEQAFDVAQKVLRYRSSRVLVIRLAYGFNSFFRSSLGLQLLRTHAPDVTRDLEVAKAVVDIQIDMKRYEQALETLFRIRDAGRLDRELAMSFVSAALATGQPALALEMADDLDPTDLTETQIYGIIDATLSLRGRSALQALENRISPERLQRQPLLCARFTVLLGDTQGTQRCVSLVEEDGVASLSGPEQIILVDIYRRSGRPEKALSLLRTLVLEPGGPVGLLDDLAELFLQLEHPEEGLSLLSELRKSHSGQEIDKAWARLSLAARRSGPVIEWLLSRRAGELSEDSLLDLFYASNKWGQAEVALMLAERLYDLRPVDMHRRNLVSALVNAGHPREAIRFLVPDLHDGDSKRREAALYALVELRAWDEVMPSLEALTEQNPKKWLWMYASAARDAGQTGRAMPVLVRIARNATSSADTSAALAALVEIGDPREVLTYVRAAIGSGDLAAPWLNAYEAILKKLERHAELHAFWWTRGRDARVPKRDRRTYAYSLLAAGERSKAQEIFQQLAQSESPQSSDVSQLLYLWGPRPGDPVLTWLAEQARAAVSIEDCAQWLSYLVSRGGSERALAIIEAKDRESPELTAVHISALHQLRRWDAMARLLRAAVPREKDIGQLEIYRQIAEAYGGVTIARAAADRILQIDPSNPAALRAQGFLEFKEGNYARSAELLKKYIPVAGKNGPAEWETLSYLGRALERAGETRESQRYLEQALAILESKHMGTSAEKRGLAELFSLTNRKHKALALYQELLLQAPSDAGLRADVANLLMDLGETRRAATILSGGG